MDGAESATFNIGTGRVWSVRELVDTAQQITERHIPVHVGSRRPGDPPILIADAARARDQLGWRPHHSDLSAQMARAWAWRQGAGKTWKRMQT
jgi:UDP-glucose 4-epimerase